MKTRWRRFSLEERRSSFQVHFKHRFRARAQPLKARLPSCLKLKGDIAYEINSEFFKPRQLPKKEQRHLRFCYEVGKWNSPKTAVFTTVCLGCARKISDCAPIKHVPDSSCGGCQSQCELAADTKTHHTVYEEADEFYLHLKRRPLTENFLCKRLEARGAVE